MCLKFKEIIKKYAKNLKGKNIIKLDRNKGIIKKINKK